MGFSIKNSVNRYWVAMALSHRKRPMQFVSSYSFETVAVLGRIILLLPPGLHSWHARPATVWLLLAAWVYNVIHLSPTCLHWCPTCLLLTCMSHDVPDLPQQHPPLGFLPDFLPSFLASLLPCGSSSEAIQQQFGSSQRQQLSNSQQLSSSLAVVAKYS